MLSDSAFLPHKEHGARYRTAACRAEILQCWLRAVLPEAPTRFEVLAQDASCRRYYRVYCKAQSYIVMDLLPIHGNCLAFVCIARAFRDLNIPVPKVHAADIRHGFLLLTDFGDQRFLDVLDARTAHQLYPQACRSLLRIQSCRQIPGYSLPRFDQRWYCQEMALFRDWYLAQHLNYSLSLKEEKKLYTILHHIAESLESQPHTCVHRDYHAGNLMWRSEQLEPGILDFQDALWGPVTYDIVSLLRDFYIEWPEEQVQMWALAYQCDAEQRGILPVVEQRTFLRWFDYTVVQRSLKCIGIFTRLKLRDHKPNYMQYIPRAMRYIRFVSARYPELSALDRFLNLA